MDFKKDLLKTGRDVVKAHEFLRKKGLASAEEKASRATAEGRIGSYIHFKELPDELAMQVAACPQVQHEPPTVTVSAANGTHELREETGAGMMDCKKALFETGGDLEKAQEYLRKKGLSTADTKSS
ncbi:hypothetical protein F2P56_002599 [Juglans regia]|uniref:Elongation factor Ts, mitochondrial n=2 Tax=Juglans regia TaxID=51240 RepID=A0A2I4E5A3_JUGRE|nr:polyprotein of EF-Ts, chloroplastic-like [Juglans regia]KAF5481995.1 hypothetical protein F2P56_002599 [Juglans regia]